MQANLALTGSVAAAASIAMEECSKQFATEVIPHGDDDVDVLVDVDARRYFLQELSIMGVPIRCGTALSLRSGQGMMSARITGVTPLNIQYSITVTNIIFMTIMTE